MIPAVVFPQLLSHPLLRQCAACAWLLLPIFGTLGIFLRARKHPGNHEKWGIAALFVLCQSPCWLLILVNVPAGLLLWTFCLCFRYGANAPRAPTAR